MGNRQDENPMGIEQNPEKPGHLPSLQVKQETRTWIGPGLSNYINLSSYQIIIANPEVESTLPKEAA